MLGLKKQLAESRKDLGGYNFYDLQNNGQLIVNNNNATKSDKPPPQILDQLYVTMSGLSITLIKTCIINVIFTEENQNVKEIIKKLDNVLLYYDMRQGLKKFMTDFNIPYFKTIKMLQLSKLHQKFFEIHILNVGNQRSMGECFMELYFLCIDVIAWEPNQLYRFIKCCGFTLQIRYGLQLPSYNMFSKIVDDKIDSKMLLNFGSKELIKLASNNDDAYIILLYAIKCMTMLSNNDHPIKKDVISQLEMLKEYLRSESPSNRNDFRFDYDCNIDEKHDAVNDGESGVLNNSDLVHYDKNDVNIKKNNDANNNNNDSKNEDTNDNVIDNEYKSKINRNGKNANLIITRISNLTVVQLKQELKIHGLSIKGNKDVLVERLCNYETFRM